MEIYRSGVVQGLLDHYGHMLVPKAGNDIYSHLDGIAHKLLEGLSYKIPSLFSEVNNYHPEYLGENIEKLASLSWDISHCRHTIANEYGFSSWSDINAMQDQYYNIEFEKCISYLLSGDSKNLNAALKTQPELTKSKSSYGHGATLLHYAASNGVELWRQQVPLNLKEMVSVLLEHGADKNATMSVYGGNFTSYALFTTSAHPIDSGISVADISEILQP